MTKKQFIEQINVIQPNDNAEVLFTASVQVAITSEDDDITKQETLTFKSVDIHSAHPNQVSIWLT